MSRSFKQVCKGYGFKPPTKPLKYYNRNQVRKGEQIELEHFDSRSKLNKTKAHCITLNHLDEFPEYYTELVKLENKLKKS